MAAFINMASLAFFASSALAKPQTGIEGVRALLSRQATDANTAASNITLTPITTVDNTLTPKPNITLNYGVDNSTTDAANNAVVNITLTTAYDGVCLESIESLAAVDCSSDSVNLTFADADTLNAAYSSWSTYANLVLVTNHVGDCDPEFERGFFVGSSFQAVEEDLTLVVGAVKQNLTDVASYMRADFSGIPASTSSTSSAAKRDIVIDSDDFTVTADFEVGPVTLFSYEDYVSVTANKAEANVSVTLSGYLDFDIWSFSLEELYVDVETSAYADLNVEVSVTASYNDSFSYDIGYVASLVDVTGILTFGPGISLAVGADLDVDVAVDVTLDVGAEIASGTLHLDLIGDDTAATGWEPTYHANLTISEEGLIAVDPFLSVTVGIEFEILGGLLDLSSGLTPKVSFPTTITLDATQEIDIGSATNGTLTVTQAGSDGCSNGVEVDSDFEFTLEAFVTEFWSTVLYNYTTAIADECYSWA